jgi:hypothetical protein
MDRRTARAGMEIEPFQVGMVAVMGEVGGALMMVVLQSIEAAFMADRKMMRKENEVVGCKEHGDDVSNYMSCT